MTNWISVKDRLPPIYSTVITCSEDDFGFFYLSFYYDKKWISRDPKHDVSKITHWLNIPPIPYKEKHTEAILESEY